MKRALIIAVDLVIMGLILFFIIQYANTKMHESNKSMIEAFEKMTTSAEQVITNYLEDEQHLCDIWSNYINRTAEAGNPMTAEEAIAFIRKAKISPSIYGHLIFPDDPSVSGISTHPAMKDSNDYSVSYRKISLFDDLDKIGHEDGGVSLTRAYTNPQNGVQSIAFMNYVTVLDENTGDLKKALLMRVEPVSMLEDKLVFLKGEYESVEISLINKDGDYLVHGKSLKNSNFFEYYKSYNNADIADYNKMIDSVTSGSGTMNMLNSKGEDCVISYTPLRSLDTWFLLAYIPAADLSTNTVVDWLLLGMVTVGLLILLVFNFAVLMVYNKKLSEAAEAANQANEAKSYFLSTMSHDIRTPMNAILGLNEMVLRDSQDDSIRMYSESIRSAGSTLLGIINDILDFSKIEAGKMELINVDYSFASLLNDLVNMVQKKAEDKGLSFNPVIDKNIPTTLNGDEIRIKQIIINILSNAAKYTEKGSITFSVHARKLEDKPGAIMLKVSVKDTGIGIKPEDIDKLFAAFERIDEKKNRNIEGTGLGMAITQRFLDMMGSHLEVQSEYGKGSVFSFELEQKVVNWEPIGDFEEAFKRSIGEHKNYREKFTAREARVLVVDDTPVNLTVFVSLLKRTGLQIDTAESGDDCISLFTKRHYDVIFLDHMMPEKDGIETLKEMKAIADTPNAATPVICLTANAISGMREMYKNAGFDDYLTKPIDAEKLESMLLSYLPKEKVTVVDGDDVRAGNGEGVRSAGTADGTDVSNNALPEFLTGIKELDLDAGLDYCGDGESLLEALQMYQSSAEKKSAEIENNWASRDIQNVTIKVHGLKSSSRAIGAVELGELAERLEKAGKDGDTDTLEKGLGELLERYRQLASDLEPLRDLE